jgi:hypothetical protein
MWFPSFKIVFSNGSTLAPLRLDAEQRRLHAAVVKSAETAPPQEAARSSVNIICSRDPNAAAGKPFFFAGFRVSRYERLE